MIIRRGDEWPFDIERSVFSQLDRIWRDLGRVVEGSLGSRSVQQAAGVFPLMNVSQDSENFYIRTEVPGLKLEDINVSVTGRSVSLSGERKIESENEKVRYHRKERESGKFRRQFNLPTDLDAEKVQARYRNGILMVVLPKAETAKPRKVAITG